MRVWRQPQLHNNNGRCIPAVGCAARVIFPVFLTFPALYAAFSSEVQFGQRVALRGMLVAQ